MGSGRANPLTLASQGAKVALLARTAAEIESAAAEIDTEGGVAKSFQVDIVDVQVGHQGFRSDQRWPGSGKPSHQQRWLLFRDCPIWDAAPEDWWRDVETNARGTFNCSRAAIPTMLAHERGRVISVVGGRTATSFPDGSGYATSKDGLLRLAECVSDTLAGSGVLVFAIDPGLVRTAMTEYQLMSEASRTYLSTISDLFEAGVDVPPTLAARLGVEIGSGRFDRLAGRMLMAARGDFNLDEIAIEEIVNADFRTLRANGMPTEQHSRNPASTLDRVDRTRLLSIALLVPAMP